MTETTHRRALILKYAILRGRIWLFGEDRKAKWCWACGVDVSWKAGAYGRLFRAEPYTAGVTALIKGHHLCPECCVEVRRRVDMAAGSTQTKPGGNGHEHRNRTRRCR